MLVSVDNALVPYRPSRGLWWTLAALGLALAGVLTSSVPAFALTLNQNDAGRITGVQSYNNAEFWLNVPTEYDVTSAPGPASIPDQQVSSSTTYQTEYHNEPVSVEGPVTGGAVYTGEWGTKWVKEWVPASCGRYQFWTGSQWASSTQNPNGTYYGAGRSVNSYCVDPIAAHLGYVQVPVWDASSYAYGPTWTTQTERVPYQVPITTTVTDSNIHLSSTLLYVQPVLYPIPVVDSTVTWTARAVSLRQQNT